MIPRLKLKKGDIPFKDLYRFSKQFYYKKVDDKAVRMKMDVTEAKITARKYFIYDPHIKKWTQDESHKRHIKFDFLVSSEPESYKRTDTIKIHRYPVTMVFFDLDMGWNSPIRWRTGSFKKVLFAQKGASKEERLRITNANIRNGRQLDFFFKLEALLAWYGLLFGVNTTNRRLPTTANPSMIPYFDKTMLFVTEKFLRFLLSKKGIIKLKEKLVNTY